MAIPSGEKLARMQDTNSYCSHLSLAQAARVRLEAELHGDTFEAESEESSLVELWVRLMG